MAHTLRGPSGAAIRAFPSIRLAEPAATFLSKSPLKSARNLEHKRQLERKHGIEPPKDNGGSIDAEEEETEQKAVLLELKGYIKDAPTTHTWVAGAPLKTWRRVQTDLPGTKVVGLSLVSVEMEGDIEVLAPLLARLKYLSTLLLQSNPRVTGDIRHLGILMPLVELRLPGENIFGNLNGITGLINLKTLLIYNRNQKVEGLLDDIKRQLPDTHIDLEVKTMHVEHE